MDETLRLIGVVSECLNAAEGHLEAHEPSMAREAHEEATIELERVRERYRRLSASRQPLVEKLAKPLSERVKELGQRLPRSASAVTQGEPEHDPEEDLDPGH
jgi:hypothetical protein